MRGLGLSLEWVWLKEIDFFPARLDVHALEDTSEICIATKSRHLGDALSLTSLPKKLKAKFPNLEIRTYPRGYNPIVFLNNPNIAKISYLPDQVFGDDANWGYGQLIQLKEQFFDLSISENPKPEIYLSESEIQWAKNFIAARTQTKNLEKPICILHPWGKTHSKVTDVEFWDDLVQRNKSLFRFWQVGLIGHGAIQGCEYYHLTTPNRRHARGLFALMSEANAFMGVDSGPMHVARAFEIPSLILVPTSKEITDLFENRQKSPYYLHQNQKFSTLYAQNRHIAIHDAAKPADLQYQVDEFFRSFP